jgi:hypothetical protein
MRRACPRLTNILGPNVAIPYQPTVDVLGHNLRTTYLANSTVRSMLKTRITSEFNGLRTTAPDPNRWILVQSHGHRCGAFRTRPGIRAVRLLVGCPDGRSLSVSREREHQLLSNPNIPEDQHTYGTAADLDPVNRTYMAACYAWYLSDRKAQIRALGYVPTSPYYTPHNIHPGSCGRGFPWQTPYGNPDAAWMIYSADSSTLKSTTWWEGDYYYNNLEKLGVCKRT